MKYIILGHHDKPDNLIKEVNAWLLKGWRLHGPVVVTGDDTNRLTYAQALVYEEPQIGIQPLSETQNKAVNRLFRWRGAVLFLLGAAVGALLTWLTDNL